MEQAAVNRKVGGSNPLSGARCGRKVGLMTDFFITLRSDFSSKSRNRDAILTALAVHEMCETQVIRVPEIY